MEEITLPTILAGPILRHVTPDSITVWLAHSTSVALELRIFGTDGEEIGSSSDRDSPIASDRPDLISKQYRPSIQLGKNLHFTLFEAKPYRVDKPFPENTLLTYTLSQADGSELPEIADVCLEGETRPGFHIATTLRALAYGSCRKAHGYSLSDDGIPQQTDALALLAQHLQAHKQDFAERPSLLFLLGDQIYADEVLPPMMVYIQQMAVQLVGKELPLPGHDDELSLVSHQRRQELRSAIGFTSTAKSLHVLSFGEYAVLYLIAFGNRIGFSVDPDTPYVAEFGDTPGNRNNLNGYINSMADVRKVFANIPTYMYFDDHDVTDDWNLSHSWYSTVRDNPAGTRVVANALAACWAFQGWGNKPYSFSTPFTEALFAHLSSTDINPTPDSLGQAEDFDFQTWKYHDWSFILRTNPPIFAIDDRTQRDFGSRNEPPQMLDRYAIDWMREEWISVCKELKARGSKPATPLFISGTPVFGFSPIEWSQYLFYCIGLLAGNRLRKLTASNLDVENWVANRNGFAYFLDTLLLRMGIKKITFIAGDVHYSFVNRASYSTSHTCMQANANKQAKPLKLECLQLTSSALHNTPSTASRVLETFLANWSVKHKSGPCNPDALPWWKRRVLWRLSPDTWKMAVWGIPGEEANPPTHRAWWKKLLIWRDIRRNGWKFRLDKNINWITSRPNVAIVQLNAGEVVKQTLLSGNKLGNMLIYRIPKK
jgi:hypothetical protein